MTEMTQARYVSFKGMNCEARADAVADRAMALATEPSWTNAFWDLFQDKVARARAADAPMGTPDVLYLVCSHVFYLEDLFDDAEDEEGLQMLKLLEHDCC
jgi:hypothetical protein